MFLFHMFTENKMQLMEEKSISSPNFLRIHAMLMKPAVFNHSFHRQLYVSQIRVSIEK